MNIALVLLAILPFIAFFASLLFKNIHEKEIALAASSAALLVFGINAGLLAAFIMNGHIPFTIPLITLYKSHEFTFSLEIYYDWLSGICSLVGAFLFWIIARFSKTYMHRESGYKRFYNHFLLFFGGINTLLLSGNFETMFLGWEIVGISSFLLISFYRERYLPIKNGLKVLSFYRIGDLALLTGIWLCHHIIQSKMSFEGFGDSTFIFNIYQAHSTEITIAGLLFVIAAAVKSAQFPFFTWLPRAMEGPTVSSAIFYGSMSIHLGVFLLLRTYPLWQYSTEVHLAIGIAGCLTACLASVISQVQSSGKSQIAYASAAQIGLIFIEISLGLHVIAMIHFVCNALLRTYQFLTSPSIMSYLVHKQFYEYTPNARSAYKFLPKKLRNTLYVLALQEFSLDSIWYRYQWKFFKKLGKSLHFLRNGIAETLVIIAMIFGVTVYIIYPIDYVKSITAISWGYSIVSLILVLIAWTERISVLRAWMYIMASQVFFMLSVAQEHSFQSDQIVLYLSGTLVSFILGYWSLAKVQSKENTISLHEFHGHIYEHPRYGMLFLISALMMVGFPVSPTFIGLDIMFSDIEFNHTFLLFISALTFFILELAVLRIYARIFLGQHVKTYHEVAFRSS